MRVDLYETRLTSANALDIFKPACEMAGYNSARANEIRDDFLVFFDPQPNKSVILTRWLSIYGVKLADR